MTTDFSINFPIKVELIQNPTDLDIFLIHDGNFVIEYSEISDKEKDLTIYVIGEDENKKTIKEVIITVTSKINSSTKDKSEPLTKPQ